MESDRSGVVIVTGAGGRLGELLVPRLQTEGFDVASIVRLAADGDGTGSVPGALEADLIDERSVSRCFDRIGREHGPVRGLIHAAGAWGQTPIETTSAAEWESLVRVNLLSTYLCFRAAAAKMSEGGSLIAFASAQGADRGVGGQSAYAAAKAGVIRIVEATAVELAHKKIATHAIAPSTILYDDDSAKGVHANDLVALCLHLLSPAGRALSGQVVRAYG